MNKSFTIHDLPAEKRPRERLVKYRIKKAEEEFNKGEYVSWEEAKKTLGWNKLEPSLAIEKEPKSVLKKAFAGEL